MKKVFILDSCALIAILNSVSANYDIRRAVVNRRPP
jgi:hypothetical protein